MIDSCAGSKGRISLKSPRWERYWVRTPAKRGCGLSPVRDMTLTIDNDVQLAAIEALDTFAVMRTYGPDGKTVDTFINRPGAVVALDPRTGEVLAMTSSPGFDPNVFSGVITDSVWQLIQADSAKPLLNRPLNGLYPPGSTSKLITLGAGLELGVINASTTMARPCIGGYQFGNRFFKCWEKNGHGVTNSVHAVEMSCDVYFYQLGLKVGVDQLSRYYELCGFGKPTGIDLPNEFKGLNPNSKYYDKTVRQERLDQSAGAEYVDRPGRDPGDAAPVGAVLLRAGQLGESLSAAHGEESH